MGGGGLGDGWGLRLSDSSCNPVMQSVRGQKRKRSLLSQCRKVGRIRAVEFYSYSSHKQILNPFIFGIWEFLQCYSQGEGPKY